MDRDARVHSLPDLWHLHTSIVRKTYAFNCQPLNVMTYQVFTISSLYILFLIGPGYAVLSILGVTKNRFLLAYGISFTILVLTLAVFQALDGTLRSWLFALFGLELLILISAISSKIRFSTRQKRLAHGIRSQSGDSVRKESGLTLVGFFSRQRL